MRFLIVFLVVSFGCLTPALSADRTGFESFVKSREVVATLYFQANSEDLVKGERERVLAAISQLRELQEDGRMIRVEGFSSPDGDVEANFQLSFFRARVVADLIETKGVPEEVTLTGYGDLRAKDASPVKERRVEIASYIKPKAMKRIRVAKKKKHMTIPTQAGVTQVTSPVYQEIDSYSVEQAIKRKIEAKNKSLAERYNTDVYPGLSQSKNMINKDELDRGYTLWRKSVDPQSAPKMAKTQIPAENDLRRGYSQAVRAVDSELQRGYSQSEKSADSELQRGYSQSEKSADSELQRGYSQSEKSADSELQRGYSQSEKSADSELQRGYSQSEKSADSELQRGYSQWIKQVDPDLSPGVTQVGPEMPPVIDALMIEQAIMEKIGAAPLEPSGVVSRLDLGY